MSTAIIKANPQLPAAIRSLLAQQGTEIMEEVTGGVTSGFPIISYRGKVWRIRMQGAEKDVVDDEGDPRPSIEVVLIKSNPMPSKIFYAKDYEEGSNDSPDCWSADGIKPDAGVQQPVCKTCAACPKNVWGSKITKQGSKTKACADARRMAVVSKQELEEKGVDAPLYLLRVPPASLNPLKDYAEKVLKPKGIPYFAVVTRIGFDSQASYPKMAFKASRYLSEDEAAAILQLRDSEDARRILAESEEFGEAGTTEGSEASADAEEATPSTPAASAPKKKAAAKPRPAEEEDVGLDEPAPAAPAPAKKKAAAPTPPPVEEEGDGDEIAAPPARQAAAAPAPAKKKAAPPPPPVEDEEEEPAPPPAPAKKKAAAPTPPPVEDAEEETPPPAPAKKKAAAKAAPAVDAPADGGDFDSMLDSILGN
jgi:hypothetical protein